MIDKILELKIKKVKIGGTKLLMKKKESIEKGLEDANSGKLKPHSEIRKNMKSGYKIFGQNTQPSELKKTIQYLQTEFSDKEISKLLIKLEETLELISINPKIFPISDKKEFTKQSCLNTILSITEK